MKDLDQPLSSSTKPAAKSDGDWKREHEKACSCIRHHVDDNVRNHIAGGTDALKLWKKLEGLYASKTGNNKLFYLTKMVQMRYKEGTSVADHLNDVQGIIDQLSGMNLKLEDEVTALLILASLPESWETLKIAITSSVVDGVVTMEDVKTGI